MVLTDTEISRMLGIPEEAARSLIKAAWPSPLVAKNTEEAAPPSSYPPNYFSQNFPKNRPNSLFTDFPRGGLLGNLRYCLQE